MLCFLEKTSRYICIGSLYLKHANCMLLTYSWILNKLIRLCFDILYISYIFCCAPECNSHSYLPFITLEISHFPLIPNLHTSTIFPMSSPHSCVSLCWPINEFRRSKPVIFKRCSLEAGFVYLLHMAPSSGSWL